MWNESRSESKILWSLMSCGWVVGNARRRRSRSGGETEIRGELEPCELYMCVCSAHISRGPGDPRVAPFTPACSLLAWHTQGRAVLSLRPLHLLWYWPHFSHLLSVPELPDCATLGGTLGVVSDVKGALGTRLRIADLPCWPCGDAWGKTAGCTSVSLGAGSPAGPFSYFPQFPVPLF